MSDEKKFRPGDPRRSYNKHRYSDNRFAWCNTSIGNFLILVGDESGEEGNDVIVMNPRPGKMPDVYFNLTRLTGEELEAFKSILTSAIEWAEPVVKLRDEEARKDLHDGDDSNPRNYRQVPQLVYRKRPITEHSESVHDGPEDVSSSPGGRVSLDRRVRGTGDELAQHGSSEVEPQDDQPQADES